jgi:hypothetical protein
MWGTTTTLLLMLDACNACRCCATPAQLTAAALNAIFCLVVCKANNERRR